MGRSRGDRDDAGVTLVELAVVVLVLGVLAGIALPQLLGQRGRAQDADARTLLHSVALAQEARMTSGEPYSPDVLDLTEVQVRPDDEVEIALYRDGTRTPAAADGSDAVGGFCVEATSGSGQVLVYDSLAGGLQPASVDDCP